MAKVDAKRMNITLACLCKPGEQHIYPVYGTVRTTGNLSVLSGNKIFGFVAVTNRDRLLVAEFSTPGVLVGSISVPLRNIKSVKTDKTLFGGMTVKIVVCDQGVNSEINLVFAKNESVVDLPYQKVNLDGLLGVLKNPEKFCKLSDTVRKEAEVKKEAAKTQDSKEKTVTKKVNHGPDPGRHDEQGKRICVKLMQASGGKVRKGRIRQSFNGKGDFCVGKE